MVALEITGKCQLMCTHCYADSGPHGNHGDMSLEGWKSVIDQAANLGAGYVQFIGGEPTMYPGLGVLIDHTLARKMLVGIYSNMVKIPASLWPHLEQEGVGFLTSYYSDDAKQHNAITGRDSHRLTVANIAEARRRGVEVNVGQIDLGQDMTNEVVLPMARRISSDHLRRIGRGASGGAPSPSELCGGCSEPRLAIMPDGRAHPCVMSRWIELGSVHTATLAEIHAGAEPTRGELKQHFVRQQRECIPRCRPNICYCQPIRPR